MVLFRAWPVLALYCILYSQATAIPDNSQQESPYGSITPGAEFYTYPTLKSSGIILTEDLEGLIPSHSITLVMHGFRGDVTAKSVQAIKQAFLLSGEQNLIIVDWGRLSDAPDMSALTAYHHVRDHGVLTAANLVARWLQRVMTVKDITPDQVHLVGFSLGAHMAGVISRLLNSTVGRITALDPPKFGYEAVPVHRRLDSTAAKFVNVIHTSGGLVGYPEPIGHVDFFPNGDDLPQPGCPTDNIIHIISCSHYMSFMLFSESVLNEHSLMATACESWTNFVTGLCNKRTKVPMGYPTSNTIRGSFFMKTKGKPPFGNDSSHPLPEQMKILLTYEENDAFIDQVDMLNFLNEGTTEELTGVANSLSAVTGSNVIRMESIISYHSAPANTKPMQH